MTKIIIKTSLLTLLVICGVFTSQKASAQDAAPPSDVELADPVSNAQMSQALKNQAVAAQGAFFDAEALVPNNQQNQGPRVVDPAMEPGSRLVLVEKSASASSYQANIVSAQRAIKLGRYESAIEILNTLYARNNKDVSVIMAMAVAYQHAGKDDLAVEAYEDLLSLDPEKLEARVNMLGIIAQKYPAVAFRQLLELQEDNASNVAIISQLAVVTANLGQYEEAIRYLGAAASMEPHNASHVFNMAVIADRAGDNEKALSYYEQALETDTLYGKGKSIPRATVFERLADLR